MLDETSALIAFVPTTDLDTARSFYAETLGLRHVEDSPYACVFDAFGTMLRVTLVDEVAHAGYTVLGWRVTDLIATARRLKDHGVAMTRYPGMDQDEHGIWTTPNGDQVAWFADPDGNTLSLTQFGSSVVRAQS